MTAFAFALAWAAMSHYSLALDSPGPLKRVVIVKIGEGRVKEESRKAAIKRFADEGLIDGRNVAIEFEERIASSPTGDGPWPVDSEQRAREIVASRPAVIMAAGDKIHLFRKITKEVPLVFYAIARDPVEWGLVGSYARPGGNLTGAAFPVGDSDDFLKLVQLFKEFRPGAKRLGVIEFEDRLQNPHREKDLEEDRINAAKLGLEHVEIALPRNVTAGAMLDAIRRAKIDLLVCSAGVGWSPPVREFLVYERIPFLCGDVRKDGLMDFNASWDEMLQNAAAIAAQVVRGANPATIPVRLPSRYILRVNVNTARELGVTVPSSVLLQADEIIDSNARERP